LIRTVDASLRRLRTDYIDLYQLHAFDAFTPIEDQLRDNLGAIGWELSPDHIALLDAASARTPAYPYWHQRANAERNPPPV
jgi:aryl-alcohol dehydrogenase-like predicted oxidoreductase